MIFIIELLTILGMGVSFIIFVFVLAGVLTVGIPIVLNILDRLIEND